MIQLDHTDAISKYCCINGIVFKLFQKYLSNTKLDAIKFEAHCIETDVAQGSMLDPLIFLTYINDMAEVSA